MVPACFENHGNYVISLGNVVRWLGQQAEALGVEIFPGFPAAEILYNDDGSVKGVATGNMGVDRDGKPTDDFQLGMELHAKYTLFAEGSRGHLGKQLMAKYDLNKGKDPQSYSIGIKELWEIDPAKHKPGLVIHTTGWPLKTDTYGGSFLYHLENNQVVVGYVIGLSYENPYLSPYEEFQRYKTHPEIRTFFEGAKRISYGARAITAGGLQVAAEAGVPGRRADRLRRRLPQHEPHQGQPRRDQDRHAGRRSGVRRAGRAAPARRTGQPTRPRSNNRGCTKSCTWRATSSRGCRKGLYLGSIMTGIDQIALPRQGAVDAAPQLRATTSA